MNVFTPFSEKSFTDYKIVGYQHNKLNQKIKSLSDFI